MNSVIKGFMSICAIATFAAFLTGCSTTPKAQEATTVAPPQEVVPPTPGVGEQDPPEVAAKKMIDSTMKGLADGNYALYSRDFSEKHKEAFNKAKFDDAAAWIKENFGACEKIEFLGSWQRRGYFLALWKAKYSKTKDDDIILEMCFKKEAGTYKIEAFKPR